jgi:predicted HD superfamily hydrolase involved in NAD metabolism
MNTETVDEITRKVDLYAKGVLPPGRYAHSLRVARLSAELCARFGVDPRLGTLAGVAHDMCKAATDKWVLSLVARDGVPVGGIERDKPSLLHGRAAATLLRDDFGVDDESVLDAVRHHTFGAPHLDALGRIVFVADKIEPGRVDYDAARRAEILSCDLDRMTELVLADNVDYLESRGKPVSPWTLAMIEELGRKV